MADGKVRSDMKEYDPQSMIESINRDWVDMQQSNSRIQKMVKETMNDLKPTGGETWQTKATAKGAVPKYYSPTELLAMRVDKLESMIQDTMAAVVNLNERLSNISSDHLTQLKKEDYE